jgi:hypothetical protein
MNLSVRNQLTIGAGLVLLMILTREYHFSSLHSLPGASWAIFFLAGLYLRAIWPLVGLFILTWALDFSAYTWGGASSFCLTSSTVPSGMPVAGMPDGISLNGRHYYLFLSV